MGTMRSMFTGYYTYNEEEYDKIWKNAVIVLDTNILLNLYRYSKKTRKILLDILKKEEKRLWIPYYVGQEYFKNRDKVIHDSSKIYSDYLKKVNDAFEELIHDSLDGKFKKIEAPKEIIESIKEFYNSKKESFSKIVEKEQKEHQKQCDSKQIEEKIFELFDNRIGEPFDAKEFKEVEEEGKRRIENDIPPGYKDKSKLENAKSTDLINGDYYNFYAMIKYAKEKKKDILFVTDDTKEDMFQIQNGQKKGGRYELLNEFHLKTNQLMLMMTAEHFVSAYEKNKTTKQSEVEDAIEELSKVRYEYIERRIPREYYNIHHIVNKNIREYDFIEYLFKNIEDCLFDGKFENAWNKMRILKHEIANIDNTILPMEIKQLAFMRIRRIMNYLKKEEITETDMSRILVPLKNLQWDISTRMLQEKYQKENLDSEEESV